MVKKTSGAKTNSPLQQRGIDVQSWDELEQPKAYPELVHSQYSNGIEIRASDDEVYIDFQELPGAIKDQKLFVKVARIYLTHDNARNLVEGMNSVLKRLEEEKEEKKK